MKDATISIEAVAEENRKLRAALAGLIPWAGQLPEGPTWATPEVKADHLAQYQAALDAACACFPEDSVINQDGTTLPLWMGAKDS